MSADADAPRPDAPREGEPVFREPWEAEAFALAVKLHEAGCFTWKEWASCLGAEIERARAAGDPDLGDTYYHHWLAALERIVEDKRILDPARLAECRERWAGAASAAPHGTPITL